jgi:uncharacterized protein DUF3712
LDESKSHFSAFSKFRHPQPRFVSAHHSFTSDAELTDLDYEHFQLEGHASAIANMSIGTLTLDPIKFNVSAGLWGLKGLQGLVSIDGVDVLGGTQDALLLATNVTIVNPSNLNLGIGDLGTRYVYSKSVAENNYSIQSSNCSRTDHWWERHSCQT